MDPGLARHGPTLAVMGGELSNPHQIEFAKTLGTLIARDSSLRICIGGYRGKQGRSEVPAEPESPGFGYTVARAAHLALPNDQKQHRIITTLTRSARPEYETDGPYAAMGTILNARGRSAEAKQVYIIREADALCVGAGQRGTRLLYDFARALDKPVIPLPMFAGVARDIWKDEKESLAEQLGAEFEPIHESLDTKLQFMGEERRSRLARACVNALIAAVRLRCLVIMPFHVEFSWVYQRVIEPAAAAAGAELFRVDLETQAGDIIDSFRREIDEADCVIGIVTGERANVMYEVGYAHALGKNVALLCQKSVSHASEATTPFYIRNHKTLFYPQEFDDRGIEAVANQLAHFFRQARIAQLGQLDRSLEIED